MNRNSSFRKVMEAQNVLLSFRNNFQNSIFSNFQYCASLRGAYNFSGNKQDFFDSLIKKVEYPEGLYLHNCEILSVKKGKIIEVTYMDKNGAASKIEAGNLIISTKWQNMRLILERKKKFSFSDFIRPAKTTHYPFTVHLGINPRCIPEKMAKHVAVIRDIHKNIYDDYNLIILESGTFPMERNSGSSKVPLSATSFLPDHQDIWSRENLIQRAKSMIQHLDYFLPFLKENIVFLDIEESINISLKQRDTVNPKYEIRNALMSGFAAKTNKTRFKNIYLTGASLVADAGFEGEILSGINAATCVTFNGKQ